LIRKLKTEISTIQNLIGHCDVKGTKPKDDCPGEEMYKHIPELRVMFGLSDKVINE
jgi:hypothetical protein